MTDIHHVPVWTGVLCGGPGDGRTFPLAGGNPDPPATVVVLGTADGIPTDEPSVFVATTDSLTNTTYRWFPVPGTPSDSRVALYLWEPVDEANRAVRTDG